MSKDQDYIVRLEKAIAEKYGKETIQNPKSNWDKEKEEEYLSQLKDFSSKMDLADERQEKVDIGGFLVPKKLLNKEKRKSCNSCGKYFLKNFDDVYMNKHGCCYNCYIKNIESKNFIEGVRNYEEEQEKN